MSYQIRKAILDILPQTLQKEQWVNNGEKPVELNIYYLPVDDELLIRCNTSYFPNKYEVERAIRKAVDSVNAIDRSNVRKKTNTLIHLILLWHVNHDYIEVLSEKVYKR